MIGTRKLGIFLPTLQIGGAERVIVEIATGLRKRGYSIEIYTMNKKGPLLEELQDIAHVIDLEVNSYKESVRALAKAYDRFRPDFVLSTLYINNVVAILARILSRHKPKIFAGAHNSFRYKVDFPDNWKDSYLLRPLAQMTLPFADGIIAVSKGVGDELCRMLRIRKEIMHVVYNPVYSKELLRRAGEPANHPFLTPHKNYKVIVAVGRLAKQKAIDDLIRAFGIIAHSNQNCRLIIIGDGSESAGLHSLSAHLRLESMISFTGALLNPLPLVAAADLFVLSSRWEGLGNVIIEALACGTPIVATDCNFGPREILDHGKFGILAPVANPAGLASSILEALCLPRDDPRCSKKTLQDRASQFSVAKAVEQYSQIFLGLVNLGDDPELEQRSYF